MNLPEIKHATVTTNNYGRINIVMDDGWHYYDLNDYETLTDDYGNKRLPKADEIVLSEVGYNFPANYDFSKIVVVAENEATEADYINALENLG